jgi:hypothetical protein
MIIAPYHLNTLMLYQNNTIVTFDCKTIALKTKVLRAGLVSSNRTKSANTPHDSSIFSTMAYFFKSWRHTCPEPYLKPTSSAPSARM